MTYRPHPVKGAWHKPDVEATTGTNPLFPGAWPQRTRAPALSPQDVSLSTGDQLQGAWTQDCVPQAWASWRRVLRAGAPGTVPRDNTLYSPGHCVLMSLWHPVDVKVSLK